ncbi:MAG TPA: hypothetical protein VFH93_04820 [Thermoleophilia bacterium]|nr:hypothetical protein [Thermoleophilia bacterium]
MPSDRLPPPPPVPAEAAEVALTVPPPSRYDDADASPALHVLLDGRCAHCDAIVVGALTCPPCAEWAASMDEWSRS